MLEEIESVLHGKIERHMQEHRYLDHRNVKVFVSQEIYRDFANMKGCVPFNLEAMNGNPDTFHGYEMIVMRSREGYLIFVE